MSNKGNARVAIVAHELRTILDVAITDFCERVDDVHVLSVITALGMLLGKAKATAQDLDVPKEIVENFCTVSIAYWSCRDAPEEGVH